MAACLFEDFFRECLLLRSICVMSSNSLPLGDDVLEEPKHSQ